MGTLSNSKFSNISSTMLTSLRQSNVWTNDYRSKSNHRCTSCCQGRWQMYGMYRSINRFDWCFIQSCRWWLWWPLPWIRLVVQQLDLLSEIPGSPGISGVSKFFNHRLGSDHLVWISIGWLKYCIAWCDGGQIRHFSSMNIPFDIVIKISSCSSMDPRIAQLWCQFEPRLPHTSSISLFGNDWDVDGI